MRRYRYESKWACLWLSSDYILTVIWTMRNSYIMDKLTYVFFVRARVYDCMVGRIAIVVRPLLALRYGGSGPFELLSRVLISRSIWISSTSFFRSPSLSLLCVDFVYPRSVITTPHHLDLLLFASIEIGRIPVRLLELRILYILFGQGKCKLLLCL